jgi:hypothetical protein
MGLPTWAKVFLSVIAGSALVIDAGLLVAASLPVVAMVVAGAALAVAATAFASLILGQRMSWKVLLLSAVLGAATAGIGSAIGASVGAATETGLVARTAGALGSIVSGATIEQAQIPGRLEKVLGEAAPRDGTVVVLPKPVIQRIDSTQTPSDSKGMIASLAKIGD